MKIYVSYDKDIGGWRRNQLDTDLMLYEGHTLPSGNAHLRQVRHLQDLAYVMEHNKTIYVLREPMELQGGQIDYEAVEFNVDFIINSSKILFVEPGDDVYRPAVQNSLAKLANVGRPR
jgi:hypothetical protein